MDITAAKESELRLLESNRKLVASQQLARMGYWEAEPDGSRVYWSDEIYSIWGLDKNTFEPSFQAYISTIINDDRERFKNYVNRVMEGKGDVDLEYRIVRPDGTIRYIFQRTGLTSDESGKPLKLRGISMDITEQKHKETELKRFRERFDLVLKTAQEAIWEWDAEFNSYLYGEGFAKIFGLRNMNTSTVWMEYVLPDDLGPVQERFEEAKHNPGTKLLVCEFRLLKPDGTIAHVKSRNHFMRDGHGNTVHIIGSMLDMTEHLAQQQTIANHTRQLGEISWTQSHVVRAPLARLMGLIALLDDHDTTVDSETRQLLHYIMQSATELDQVIHDIVAKTQE